MIGKHFVSVAGLSREDFLNLFEVARRLKNDKKNVFAGRTLGMLFEKPSLRTRVSFEVAMTQLGGSAIDLTGKIHSKESLRDQATVLSRYVDFIMLRTFSHGTIETFAEHSTVPVINGLSCELHPCQALADFLTIFEKKEGFSGLKIVYVGDCGCNTAHSTMLAASILGVRVVMLSPDREKYGPKKEYLELARRLGGEIKLTSDLDIGVAGADVVYNDVWVSMGMEDKAEQRLSDFDGFQVDSDMLRLAKPDFIYMHCLPRTVHEVTDSVFYSKNSVVFDQAENRLHAQKALLFLLAGCKSSVHFS